MTFRRPNPLPPRSARPRRSNRSRRALRAARVCLLLPVFLLATTAVANAATLYVDQKHTNCSNTGSGTATQPFCAIGAAASRTTAGTIVSVSAGTYNERVNVKSGAAGSPVTFRAEAGETVTVKGQVYGFYVSGRSWVNIQGFDVVDTTDDGIHISSGSKNVEVVGTHVTDVGERISGKTAKGIAVTDSSDVRVEGTNVERGSTYGIYIADSTNVDVVGNTLSLNAKQFERAASGIRVYNADANTISSNVSHDNEDSGIELVSGSDNNLVVNNVTYHNGDHGIDVTNTALGQRVISNSVYNNVTAGINVEGGSTGASLANNVSVDNAISSPRTTGNIRVDSASTMGTTLDYDLVYMRNGGRNFEWNGLGYTTLAQFRLVSGQEPKGIEADPRWAAPSSGDFGLESGSPAIDSANSGASGQQATDAAGSFRVDVPTVPNTGAGPRSYDDRGAYEHQLQNAPPSAALTVTPSSGRVDLQVSADASASSDSDGLSPIESYSFDFGDGSQATGPQPEAAATHTYKAAGTYTVTVTVKDTAGLTSTETKQVTVTDDPPAAALAVTPSSGLVDLEVSADASASSDGDGTPIESYSFDFGDGSPEVGPQAEATAGHTYKAAGTYTVTVTVKDTAGLTSTQTKQVTVTDDPPTAALSVTPSSGEAPLRVSADASASTDGDGTPIESYSFDFGDGSPTVGPQEEATAEHVFTQGGTYNVTVTVKDKSGLESQATTRVTVSLGLDSPPTAALALTPDSGVVDLGVTADASGSTDEDLVSPIESYSFDFGDGSPAVGPQPEATAQHSYTSPGTYTVTVTVKDTLGLSATDTKQVTVRDDPPAAALSVTPASGTVDLGVTADASGSTDEDATPIESYSFDFGDGSPKVGPQPEASAHHTYTAAGTHTVTVTVKDTAGHSSTESKQVTVTDNAPSAALAVAPSSGVLPLAVTADASASTDADATKIASYSFDFGDGSPAVGPQPEATAAHTYTAAGTYTVKVTVKDSAGLSATATAQVVARANFVRNPGFETDLSGWNTSGSGSGVTLTRSSTAHSGSWGAKLTNTGTSSSTCTLNDSPDWAKPTLAGRYTGSVWVRADSPGATLKLRFSEWSGSALAGSAVTLKTLSTSWQQVSVAYTTVSPGSTLDLNAYVSGAAPGTCFYADDAVIVLD